MFPILLRLGPLTLHTYGVLVALGFLAAVLLLGRDARRTGLPADRVMDLGFVIVLAAIVGSRLLYVLLHLADYRAEPLRILKLWEGGLVFHGGLLLAVPASWLYIRHAGLPLWRTADLTGPAIALGQAIGRLGCLAAGCCYGCPSDAPWAITFTHPESLAPRYTPLFPVQLFSSLSLWAVFAILLSYRHRRHADGQVFWLYLVLASGARVVEDYFRGEAAASRILPWLTATQGISLLLGAVALLLFVRFGRHGITVTAGDIHRGTKVLE